VIRSITRSTPPLAAAQNDPGGSGSGGDFYEPLQAKQENSDGQNLTDQEPAALSENAKSTAQPPKLQVLTGGKKALTSWMGAIVGLTKKLPKARGDYQTDMDRSKGILCDKKAE
jgi:hypothetical protein